jgi:hypothetical protein
MKHRVDNHDMAVFVREVFLNYCKVMGRAMQIRAKTDQPVTLDSLKPEEKSNGKATFPL